MDFRFVLTLLLLGDSPKVAKPHPPEASAAFSRGCYYSALHDCERAVGYWEEALRLDPVYWESHLKMADCLLTLKQPEKAIEQIGKARTINPDAGASLLEKASKTTASEPARKGDRVLWTLTPMEAELQELTISIWADEAARRSGTLARSYTKVVDGNVYRITRNADGTTDEVGSNAATGANAHRKNV